MTLTHTATLHLLGVEFRLTVNDPELLGYLPAFVDAYDWRDGPSLPIVRRVEIVAQYGPLPRPTSGDRVPVHYSKTMAYWNFEGHLHQSEDSARAVTWTTHGLFIVVEPRAESVRVTVSEGADPLRASESLFHMCRGLALYLRAGWQGNLLHASAVDVGGRAVLFSGKALAGKTTLMLESILQCGAHPLSNDRVLVTTDPHPAAVSWPGYASFCEGTLLRYPALTHAAQAYETEPGQYRSLSWPYPLKPVFRKTADTKRMYPMVWLRDALGKKYVPRRPLGALVLARLSSGIKQPVVDRYDLSNLATRRYLLALLRGSVYDRREPAFAPWHGLSLPRPVSKLTNLLDRLADADIPVLKVELRPDDFTPLYRIIERVAEVASQCTGTCTPDQTLTPA